MKKHNGAHMEAIRTFAVSRVPGSAFLGEAQGGTVRGWLLAAAAVIRNMLVFFLCCGAVAPRTGGAAESMDPDAAVHIWHAYTLRAAGGMLEHHFEAMTENGRRMDEIVLNTNAGQAIIKNIGGAGYRRNASFTLTSRPLQRLAITWAKVDGKVTPDLDWLSAKTPYTNKTVFDVRPMLLAPGAAAREADPALGGKKLNMTLAPAIPAMQQTGVFLFSLEGDPGFPEVKDISVRVLGGISEKWSKETELDRIAQGMTQGGVWHALLRYEGFNPPDDERREVLALIEKFDLLDAKENAEPSEEDPRSVLPLERMAPSRFHIIEATGFVAGKRVDLLPALRLVPLKQIPVVIAPPPMGGAPRSRK